MPDEAECVGQSARYASLGKDPDGVFCCMLNSKKAHRGSDPLTPYRLQGIVDGKYYTYIWVHISIVRHGGSPMLWLPPSNHDAKKWSVEMHFNRSAFKVGLDGSSGKGGMGGKDGPPSGPRQDEGRQPAGLCLSNLSGEARDLALSPAARDLARPRDLERLSEEARGKSGPRRRTTHI